MDNSTDIAASQVDGSPVRKRKGSPSYGGDGTRDLADGAEVWWCCKKEKWCKEGDQVVEVVKEKSLIEAGGDEDPFELGSEILDTLDSKKCGGN